MSVGAPSRRGAKYASPTKHLSTCLPLSS